jgi:hypothetical protein
LDDGVLLQTIVAGDVKFCRRRRRGVVECGRP